jgi:SSS family solute:Na+ symporter
MIAVYVAVMLGVGAWYSYKARTQDDYLLGGRSMNPWGVGLSYFATMFSTLTYLGIPGELVRHGPMILCQLIGLPLAALLVGRSVIPLIMRQPVTTAHELLETRLGLSVRTLAATIFLLMRLLWMALVIHATSAVVLVPVMRIDPSLAPLVGIAMAAITVAYTSMGGFKAVVVTDVLQTVILFGGALLTIGVVTADFGGFGWLPTQWAPHWQPPSFGFDPTARLSLLNTALAVAVWHSCTAASDQMAVQRYLATRDATTARQMLFTGLACVAAVTLTLAAVGAAILGYSVAHPDILGGEQAILTNADGIFPRFIADVLPSGIRGLVIGGLLAAAMSSLSSGLSSVTAVVAVDFIERLTGRKAAEFYGTLASRLLPWGVGAMAIVLGVGVGRIEGNILELCNKVVNLLVVPLAGLFFMAMFVRSATPFGAWVGAAGGMAAGVLVSYWKDLTGTSGIAFFWMMPVSLAVQMAVGCLASLLPIGPPARPLLTEQRGKSG